MIKAPDTLGSSISWRKQGIKYTKNECYLDVIERLHLLVGANGQTIHSDVKGSIQVKSFLSGMPELRLGLNDKTFFEMAGKKSKHSGIFFHLSVDFVCYGLYVFEGYKEQRRLLREEWR